MPSLKDRFQLSRGKTYLSSNVHKDGTDAPTLVDVMTSLGRKKTESKRYPKQVLYFVKVNTSGKLETRTKGIVGKCSDLTCTRRYASTEGPKSGGERGEITWATRSLPPPSHFMPATGLHVIASIARDGVSETVTAQAYRCVGVF